MDDVKKEEIMATEKMQVELDALEAENSMLKEELQKLRDAKIKKSVFQTLNEYDITEDIKSKNDIIYLPWSKAWTILKTLYPGCEVEVIENGCFDCDDPIRYFTDGKTAWVKTSITIEGHTETESLAVMDFRNKSIPLANITSADVEKSIKRCFVKCAALHGLGLSLWTGEELSKAASDKIEKDLDEIKKDIIVAINQKLESGVQREQIYKVIESIAKTKNPNAIRDIQQAKKVAEQIKKLEVKKNAE